MRWERALYKNTLSANVGLGNPWSGFKKKKSHGKIFTFLSAKIITCLTFNVKVFKMCKVQWA